MCLPDLSCLLAYLTISSPLCHRLTQVCLILLQCLSIIILDSALQVEIISCDFSPSVRLLALISNPALARHTGQRSVLGFAGKTIVLHVLQKVL